MAEEIILKNIKESCESQSFIISVVGHHKISQRGIQTFIFPG